ncbi:9571_t:CDS:2, partial [Racocetra persica]
RKKAIFEVFHYRGFLRRAISLGKAQLKLDSLAGKAEIHEVLDLVDNNRKPTGGKLEVRLRLRSPLLKPDIIQKTEKWLVVHGFNLNNPIANTQVSAPSPKVASVKSSSVTSQSDPLGLPTASDPSTQKKGLPTTLDPSTPIKGLPTASDSSTPIKGLPTASDPSTPIKQQTPAKSSTPSVKKTSNTIANTPTQVHNKLPSQVSTPVSKPNPSVTN